MAKQGIAIKFSENDIHYWTIITKPSGMTEYEANDRVMNLLKHQFIGPWSFTITP